MSRASNSIPNSSAGVIAAESVMYGCAQRTGSTFAAVSSGVTVEAFLITEDRVEPGRRTKARTLPNSASVISIRFCSTGVVVCSHGPCGDREP